MCEVQKWLLARGRIWGKVLVHMVAYTPVRKTWGVWSERGRFFLMSLHRLEAVLLGRGVPLGRGVG